MNKLDFLKLPLHVLIVAWIAGRMTTSRAVIILSLKDEFEHRESIALALMDRLPMNTRTQRFLRNVIVNYHNKLNRDWQALLNIGIQFVGFIPRDKS